MIKLKTDLISIELITLEDNNSYEFKVEILTSGEDFYMSYSPEGQTISSICLANQLVVDGSNVGVSSKTGRAIIECYKDLQGAMGFYIKEIMQFLIKLYPND